MFLNTDKRESGMTFKNLSPETAEDSLCKRKIKITVYILQSMPVPLITYEKTNIYLQT